MMMTLAQNGNIVGTWLLVEANNVPVLQLMSVQGNLRSHLMQIISAPLLFSLKVGEIVISKQTTGNWSNSSGSKYTIEVPGFDEPLAGTVAFSNDNRFTFTPNDYLPQVLTFERN